MKRILFLLALVWLFGDSYAQTDLEALMAARGEYYFSLPVQHREETAQLTRLCSIDKMEGNHLICYANEEQYRQLLAKGYHPNLLTPPSMLEHYAMWDGTDREAYDWDAYPDLTEGERNVALLSFLGFRIKEEAVLLHLSENTVMKYRSNIKKKVGFDPILALMS